MRRHQVLLVLTVCIRMLVVFNGLEFIPCYKIGALRCVYQFVSFKWIDMVAHLAVGLVMTLLDVVFMFNPLILISKYLMCTLLWFSVFNIRMMGVEFVGFGGHLFIFLYENEFFEQRRVEVRNDHVTKVLECGINTRKATLEPTAQELAELEYLTSKKKSKSSDDPVIVPPVILVEDE